MTSQREPNKHRITSELWTSKILGANAMTLMNKSAEELHAVHAIKKAKELPAIRRGNNALK